MAEEASGLKTEAALDANAVVALASAVEVGVNAGAVTAVAEGALEVRAVSGAAPHPASASAIAAAKPAVAVLR
ncbi:hypothetical protein OMP38_09880 [Cohnella ginsengisoli]|uniref:Uncharacterized protein n=1 Tax=Cohnella ginsengisoli TaxID=425004 RepID=A0A9X4KG78_9BACL|nr:hypothetical protein [Cohnella ginsengisoli]MDG0791146.1 hypothetical protein [Cohnella ginsengisoli]